jgi:uncharacterized protein
MPGINWNINPKYFFMTINKTTLITGASSGIGYEMSKVFARNNYNLVLVARRTEPMEDLKNEFPNIDIKIIQKDLSVDGSCQEVFDSVNDLQIDVLVNNAGFGDTGEFQTLSLDKQTNMIDLNVRALTELTHLFSSKMVKSKAGKILNVASVVAFMPGPKMATYFATKAFVLSFSQALSQEWGKYGVQVMALCPGVTTSGFQVSSGQTHMEMIKAKDVPTSAEVAQYAYDSLMAGKSIAVHKFINKLYAFLPRILPRKLYLIIMENALK